MHNTVSCLYLELVKAYGRQAHAMKRYNLNVKNNDNLNTNANINILTHFFPDEAEDPHTSYLSAMNYRSQLSKMISEYAMFPLLVMISIIYVPMNLYLLYTWISSSPCNSIVNKIICFQRVLWIVYCIESVVDFFLILNGLYPSFMSLANYCSCRIFFYKFCLFMLQTTNLSMALVRFMCVKYSIEYHNR